MNSDGSTSHGAAIHSIQNGQIRESFWYADESINVRSVQSFYLAVDTLALTELDELVVRPH